jgi:hypothetical protein
VSGQSKERKRKKDDACEIKPKARQYSSCESLDSGKVTQSAGAAVQYLFRDCSHKDSYAGPGGRATREFLAAAIKALGFGLAKVE